ncbi:terminase [Candidatus Dependentiae bacterium]|nr:MAG: terminase [Candidatus Dependentiae bacterium]
MGIFPWGEPFLADGETENPLKDKTGPEPWQEEELKALGAHIRNNAEFKAMGLELEVWKSAIASGHGVGKSAMVSWIIIFLMSTRADTRGAVTASTQFQLEDKTWPELAKWHNLAMNKHWFTWTATGFTFSAYPEDKQKNYKVTAATVSETKTEAFAGLHNEGKTVFVIFDEASGVLPKVWEVVEGALTDGEAFFFAYGNPTRPDGEFADCFDKHAHLYRTRHIDSREVSHTNKSALEGIIRKYGIDSDEVKVRIRGQFPQQSFNGFISVEIARMAMEREHTSDPNAGLIMAVDVARYGNDHSCIRFRQGRDARSIPAKRFKGLSLVKLAEICMREADIHKPDAIVIEATGIGAGVIDIMRDRGYKVIEVHPGAKAHAHELYINRRAEYWSLMRDWLYEEGCVDDTPELFSQLTTILYMLDRHEQRLKLEPKEEMKKRGLPSPDDADTLALTFAVRIARRDRTKHLGQARNKAVTEYDELAY